MKIGTEMTAYSFASVTATSTGIVASVQTLLDPANAWVPLGVLLSLLGVSIVTTVKVVRLLDGVRADIALGKVERRKLAKAQGVDLNGDGHG